MEHKILKATARSKVSRSFTLRYLRLVAMSHRRCQRWHCRERAAISGCEVR